ncbi:Pro-Pol polyprotein [Nosema granulosis]|uniref:Pro-Pol polyprotein n=1 Tax=Nosema granulosis TaxID=83296 RepID=A0A9P6GY55_9MICR|nr:Pro-Pol polyprotein [Nosema granulosis]
MGDADAFNRQYQDENCEGLKEPEKSKQLQGKIKKHVIVKNGKEYWEFDDGTQREIPGVEERELVIREIHANLNHRGIKGTYYQLKQRYYWPWMKDRVSRILKECETCQVANRKNKGEVEFVTSSRKGEMFAIDVMEIGEPRRCVLVGIDYYKRHLRSKILEKRTSEEIVGVLEEWFTQNYLPKGL